MERSSFCRQVRVAIKPPVEYQELPYKEGFMPMSEGCFKPITGQDAKNAYTQVYTDDRQYTIELGDPFWDASATGQDSKAGILSHEMSHFEGGAI